MSFSGTGTKDSFTGDGITTDFNISFFFLTKAELEIMTRTTAGVETTHTEGGTYSVLGVDLPNGIPGTGIRFTVAPASGVKVFLRRKTLRTQTLDPAPGVAISNPVLESHLDRTVMLVQEVEEALARVPKFKKTTPSANLSLELPEPEADKFLKWNAAGTALELTDEVTGIEADLTGIADGDLLQYDAASGTMIPVDPSALGIPIGSLTPVAIVSAATGDILRFDGTNWVDYPDSNYAPSSTGATAAAALAAHEADTTSIHGIADTSTLYRSGGTDVAVADGGTGASTALAGFNALSPLTTKGDMLTRDSTNNIRVGVGSDGQVWTADSAQTAGAKWATPSGAPDQSYELNNLGLAISASAGALTIALKIKDGSTDASAGSPVKIGFRSSTQASGAYNQRSVTAALSVVIPSTATMGFASAKPHYLWVYAIDNAGTVELAVASTRRDEDIRGTTTAIGVASDSISGFYSTTARSNVPIRIIARLSVNLTTAGTWVAAEVSSIHLGPFSPHDPIYCKTYGSTTTLTNNTATKIVQGAGSFDSHNTEAGGTYTIPIAGMYLIYGQVSYADAAAAAAARWVELRQNGAAIITNETDVSTGTSTKTFAVTTLTNCITGDTIELYALQNSGLSVNLNGGVHNQFWITRVGELLT